MELWTEYEGRTIDGVFPLAKLLQPEGRSAFFSTPNGSGTPTVIRLIESHFDDDEILARWRGIAALNHPNFVKLKQFGKVELDGTPLVYAVMEPADGNLGEIVGERRLSVEETREVAASLVAALGALHEHGFVHEHVEPGSVLAVGDAIKLRSDCIRETPEGEEGAALRRKDVHDLAAVLLRALTQRRTLAEAAADMPLAAPFGEIVSNGMSGVWGLREINAALASRGVSRHALNGADAVTTSRSVEKPVVTTASVAREERFRAEPEEASGDRNWVGLKILLGLSVLVLGLIAWHMFHGHPAQQSNAAQKAVVPAAAVPEDAPAAVSSTAPVNSVNPVNAVASKQPVASSSSPADVAPAAVGPHVEWRVIAFTYNHEDQAQTKASRLAGRHPELKPEVFTPNGHAPYLVTIGGAMSREDAYALARKARGDGVASDVYAQNFRLR